MDLGDDPGRGSELMVDFAKAGLVFEAFELSVSGSR